ncbi:MAG: CotH kinase family protein [Paludibacteraceae bacterium]|nr:CotH kinase family protein [Paludibacteraceae bacterium]
MRYKNINLFSGLAKSLLVSTCTLTAASSFAGIKITEIMPSNISTIVSDKYDYNGYVEIYNDGENIDLNGWTVTNEKEGKVSWSIRLSQSHVIKKGYNLLFFGKEETNGNNAQNVNPVYIGSVPEKLTADAGKLILTNGSQTISIEYPKQFPHVSYADDGYMIPSPGKDNTPAYKIEDRVSAPTFSGTNPGIVNGGNATVQLQCPTSGAKIYYTLDGSIPTLEKGTLYESPISINKTTVVRARAFKDDAIYSDVVTGSFLFTESIYASCGRSNLPVVSINSDRDHFYGDKLGICVKGNNGAPSACSSDYNGNANYNQEWMRPANFEYIVDGKVVDSQEVEVGVFGGCSRSHNVKSFKIKANKRTGSNKFQYTKFFADRTYTKYKALALRNGGNGWYLYPRWRDGFMQSLAKGMNVDYQAYQPVAYFLNGEYKGLMGLRERTDEDYVYSNYGLDEDEIEYLRVMKDLGKYVAEIGTDEAYYNMESYAQSHNSDADFFDKLGEMMDIDEYIDYQIIQQFVANTDWVNNNTKLWRKKDGGKFRWILFDVDFGMSQHTNVNNNMLLFTTTGNATDNSQQTPGGPAGPGGMPGFGGGNWGGFGGGFGGTSTVDQKYCTLFKSCMQNEDFKYKFLDRYTYLLETQFSEARINTVLDSIKQLTKEEACAMMRDNSLGGGSQQQYESGIESMLTFATQRAGIIEKQLVNYYSVEASKADVKVRMNFNGNTPEYKFWVNKIEQKNSTYDRKLFVGERIKVEVRVPAGYKIKEWIVNGETISNSNDYYLGKVTNEGADIEVVLAADSEFKIPRLFINEVCASNGSTEDEYGSKPDWIEIYNAENHDIDLAGIIIRNETSGKTSEFPYDYSSTIIPAHGRVIVWADKDQAAGPLHLAFKLSAATPQKLSLVIPYMGKEEKIDEITYQLHDRDGSYGKSSDGSSDAKVFDACSSSDRIDRQIASPREANGSLVCTKDIVIADLDETLASELVYPNPASSQWTLNAEGEYIVTNMIGQVIESGVAYEGMMFGGDYPTGVYMLKINDIFVKIVKQ